MLGITMTKTNDKHSILISQVDLWKQTYWVARHHHY